MSSTAAEQIRLLCSFHLCVLYVKRIIITNLQTKLICGLREALVAAVFIIVNSLKDRTRVIIYIKQYGLRLSPDLGSAF